MMRALYMTTIVCCGLQTRMLIRERGRSTVHTAMFVTITMALATYVATLL